MGLISESLFLLFHFYPFFFVSLYFSLLHSYFLFLHYKFVSDLSQEVSKLESLSLVYIWMMNYGMV